LSGSAVSTQDNAANFTPCTRTHTLTSFRHGDSKHKTHKHTKKHTCNYERKKEKRNTTNYKLKA